MSKAVLGYHLTLKSSNTKTGPIPVSTTSAESCPTDCPFNHANQGGCYAEQGPLALFWAQVTAGTKGVSYDVFLSSVSALPYEQLWRHDQAGDLPGKGNVIDTDALMLLVEANRGKRGFTYTHKPVLGSDSISLTNRAAIEHANENGFVINLSGNNLAHADELAALAIAPVVTVLPIAYARTEKRVGKKMEWSETLAEYRDRTKDLPKATPAGRAMAPCPATYLDTTCDDCQLCQRANRKVIVGFPAHGSAKAKADAIAQG